VTIRPRISDKGDFNIPAHVGHFTQGLAIIKNQIVQTHEGHFAQGLGNTSYVFPKEGHVITWISYYQVDFKLNIPKYDWPGI
jgi:hypothetical protein